MTKLKLIRNFLRSRPLSEGVLFLNLVFLFLITFHFESLNLLLKSELASLQNDIHHVQHLNEQFEHFNSLQNAGNVEKPFFFFENEKEIATIAIIAFAALFFFSKMVGGGYIPHVNYAISDLNESANIVNSDANEVLKPFEQNADLFNHVQHLDQHLDIITKTDARTLSVIDLKTDRFINASEALGDRIHKMEAILKEVARQIRLQK